MNKYKLANTTIDINKQIEYSQDKDHDLRISLAGNGSLFNQIQCVLAKDYDYGVRRGLAHNLALTVDAQHVLAKDYDVCVRRNLALNTSITDDIQMLLADEFPENIENPGPKTAAYLKMKKVLDK